MKVKVKDIYGEEHVINQPGLRGIVNGKRTQTKDTTLPPYNSVVHVLTPGGLTPAASGSVIGQNSVLTAAHVAEVMVTGSPVTPALNGEDTLYGSFRVKSIHMPDEWISDHDLTFDYAVIIVEENAQGKNIGSCATEISGRCESSTILILNSTG